MQFAVFAAVLGMSGAAGVALPRCPNAIFDGFCHPWDLRDGGVACVADTSPGAKITKSSEVQCVPKSNGGVHYTCPSWVPKMCQPVYAGSNIVGLAVATPDLSTLVTALKAGKLTDALSGTGPFTVFAPTNEAFAKLPKSTLDHLLDPKNIKELDAVLEYHVIAGAAVYKADLKSDQKVKTLEGQDVDVMKAPSGEVFVNKAQVITADVDASNGVVHIIDSVLIDKRPDSVLQTLQSGFNDMSGTGVLISMEYCHGDACGPDQDPHGVPAHGGSASLFRQDHAGPRNQIISWTNDIVKPWGYLWFANNTQAIAKETGACVLPVDSDTDARVGTDGRLDKCGTAARARTSSKDLKKWNAIPRYCCSPDCAPEGTTHRNISTCMLDMMDDAWAQVENVTWVKEHLVGPWFYNEVVLSRWVDGQVTLPNNGVWPMSVPAPDVLVLLVCNRFASLSQQLQAKYGPEEQYREVFLSQAALGKRLGNVRGTAVERTGVVVLHQCPDEDTRADRFIFHAESLSALSANFNISCYWESGVAYSAQCSHDAEPADGAKISFITMV